MLDPLPDVLLERGDAYVGTTLDLLRGELAEPTFHHVEPRSRGGREVQVEPGMAEQPTLDLGRLVGGVVVEHEVDGEVSRHLLVDLDEEPLELARPVALCERPDDLARRHVERGEQAGRAVADVVVGSPLGGGGHHRQDRLEAVERLDLGLLVDAEHDGSLGRVQVETDDVADLLDKERVGGELEGLGPVWLEGEGVPDPVDRRPAHPHLLGHRAGRPVGGVLGLLLEGLHDHRLDLVIGDGPRCARSGIVEEAGRDHRTLPTLDHRNSPGDERRPGSCRPWRRSTRPAPAWPSPGRSCADSPDARAPVAPRCSAPALPSAGPSLPCRLPSSQVRRGRRAGWQEIPRTPIFLPNLAFGTLGAWVIPEGALLVKGASAEGRHVRPAGRAEHLRPACEQTRVGEAGAMIASSRPGVRY